MLALAGGIFLGLVARPTMALDVIRDRNALYRIADNGEIENVYTFKLMNKSETDDVYELAAAGVDGIHFHREPLFAEVRAGEVWTLPVRLRAPRNSASGGQTIRIMMFRRGEPPEAGIIEEARFFMPGRDND